MEKGNLKKPKLSYTVSFAIVVISFAVIGIISALISTIHISQSKLRKVSLEQLSYDAKDIAIPLSHFCSERKNDLKALLADRDIVGRLKLGDFPEEGLEIALGTISGKLDEKLKEINVYGEKIYTRFTFLDKKGNILSDKLPSDENQELPGHQLEDILLEAPKPEPKKAKMWPWEKYLTPEKRNITVVGKDGGESLIITISAPFFFEEHYLGQILADISYDAAYNHLPVKESSDSPVGIVFQKKIYPLTSARISSAILDKVKIGKSYLFKNRNGKEMVVTMTEVGGTPFSLIMVVPSSELFTAVPWYLFLAVAIIIVAIILWRINVHNTVMHARIIESDKRREEAFDFSSRKAFLEVRVKKLDAINQKLKEENTDLKVEIKQRKRKEEKLKQMLNSRAH